MIKLKIRVPAVEEGQYTIQIGSGLLAGLWDRIKADYPKSTRFVVTDQNLVDAGQLNILSGGRDIPAYVINPPGEVSKTIDTAIHIVETMEQAYLGRDSVIVALGGGTVGDIAGFAAAMFKRGIPVVQVPTTTLAQADSAVGGKTGVDSSLSKNAFGAFWHPSAVYIDVDTLKTLDDREFRSGLVESVKHALIADAEYFDTLEANLEAILAREPEVLKTIALKNCQTKGHVVEIDPNEKNMRRILNYGHTVGHAVESASDYTLLHGESIAVGIVAAGLIEMELGIGDPARLDRVLALLEKLGMPTKIPAQITEQQLIDLIKRDKKAVDQWPKFVLINQIGQVHQVEGQWAVSVERTVVEKVLKRLY